MNIKCKPLAMTGGFSGTIRERHRFLVVGYVVIPDHVHAHQRTGQGHALDGASGVETELSRGLRKTGATGACFGSARRVFMTSTFPVRRQEGKTLTTCTLTRSSADWRRTRRRGYGAVRRSMGRGKRD